jgi:hypothetical protein
MPDGSGTPEGEIPAIKPQVGGQADEPLIIKNKEILEAPLVAKDNSAMESDNEQEPVEEFDTDLRQVSMEWVDRVEVERSINEIGQFYNVSKEKIKQAVDTTRMYRLDNIGFDKTIRHEIKENFEEYEKRARTDEERMEVRAAFQFQMKHAKDAGGMVLQHEKGQDVYVKRAISDLSEKEIEIHELIHALGGDFKIGQSGFRTLNGEYRNINEAATEILTAAFIHKDLSQEELISKIFSGEIKTSYFDDVKLLLVSMDATIKHDEKSFKIQDLADYYFQNKPDHNIYTLQWDLVSRAEGELKGVVKDTLMNDLRKVAVR